MRNIFPKLYQNHYTKSSIGLLLALIDNTYCQKHIGRWSKKFYELEQWNKSHFKVEVKNGIIPNDANTTIRGIW